MPVKKYMTFRLLNVGDHFIFASGNISHVCPIYYKMEPVESKSKPGTFYNARSHFHGNVDRIPDETLVIAVMMPDWATREGLERREREDLEERKRNQQT